MTEPDPTLQQVLSSAVLALEEAMTNIREALEDATPEQAEYLRSALADAEIAAQRAFAGAYDPSHPPEEST